jgi:hypothetical protein
MRKLIAATVTLDDLKQYFQGEHWRATPRGDGSFESRSDSYLVELSPVSGPQFAVSIQAHEDEMDKDEVVTDDPMKFIVDFLKTGTEGDEAFGHMATEGSSASYENYGNYGSPAAVANLLRTWAVAAERGRIGPRSLARLLRHAALLADLPDTVEFVRLAVHLVANREEIETQEMQDLANRMTQKGWRVQSGKNDRGFPDLTVDIAGIYEAKIEIDHIPWKYSFEVHEHPDSRIEGITDDPIVEFRKFYKSEPVQSAKFELKDRLKARPETAEAEGTVAPSKKKKPEPYHYDGFESGRPS